MDGRASTDQLATLMAESENNINGIIRSSRIAGPANQARSYVPVVRNYRANNRDGKHVGRG